MIRPLKSLIVTASLASLIGATLLTAAPASAQPLDAPDKVHTADSFQMALVTGWGFKLGDYPLNSYKLGLGARLGYTMGLGMGATGLYFGALFTWYLGDEVQVANGQLSSLNLIISPEIGWDIKFGPTIFRAHLALGPIVGGLEKCGVGQNVPSVSCETTITTTLLVAPAVTIMYPLTDHFLIGLEGRLNIAAATAVANGFHLGLTLTIAL